MLLEVRVEMSSLFNGCTIIPLPYFKKTVPSPFQLLGCLCQIQLTTSVSVFINYSVSLCFDISSNRLNNSTVFFFKDSSCVPLTWLIFIFSKLFIFTYFDYLPLITLIYFSDFP
jgi:hypothetical protein